MTVARALAVLAALAAAGATPVAAQMPDGIVGGTNLIEAARTPIPVGVPSSSDRTTAPETRAMGGAGTISLGAISASPGGVVPAPEAPDGVVAAAVPAADPAAALAEPGAPIRVRHPIRVPGEPVRATTRTVESVGGRTVGSGAVIVIPAGNG